MIENKRFICSDGKIREMTDAEAAHQEVIVRVREEIMVLFKVNGITLAEAEHMLRGIVDHSTCKAKREITFLQLYSNT